MSSSLNPHMFWDWISTNSDRLRKFDSPRKEMILDEILEHLHAYHPQLFFEIGGAPNGPIEIIITAEGKRENFDAVRTLMRAMPTVPGWEFIGFKPPQGFVFSTQYGAAHIQPRTCWFLPLTSNSRPVELGIRIGCPEYKPELNADYANAILIVLDTALGELQAAEEIQHVEIGAVPHHPELDGYIELPELPAYLEWRRIQK